MSKKKKKGTYTLEKMRPIVADYEFYKGKKLDYCKEHDLNRYTFDYWRNKIKALELESKDDKTITQNRPPKFIAIQAPSPSSINASVDVVNDYRESIQLHMPDGKRLELPTSVSEKLLLSLLQLRIK